MVSLLIVSVPAICWALSVYYKSVTDVILVVLMNLLFAFSCLILVWGLQKLIRTVQQANDHLVNKSMIFWISLCYLLIIITTIVENFSVNKYLQYEVTMYVLFAINLVTTIILALIINEIRSKASQQEPLSDTDSPQSLRADSPTNLSASSLLH